MIEDPKSSSIKITDLSPDWLYIEAVGTYIPIEFAEIMFPAKINK